MATASEALRRIWNDPEFKKQLLANPRPALAELGMSVPEGCDVRVWENTPHEMNFVLPDPADMPPGHDARPANTAAERVMRKAWKEPSFKAKLLSNPKGAIADAAGIDLPAALQVRVHEDTAKVRNLILPVNPASEDLSDADLEGMAGGAMFKGPAAPICGAALGSGGMVFAGGANPGLGFLGGLPGSDPVAPGSALGPANTVGIGNSSFGPC